MEDFSEFNQLFSLWVSRTGSRSEWCALQEALYKCIDTIQYNNIKPPSASHSDVGIGLW